MLITAYPVGKQLKRMPDSDECLFDLEGGERERRRKGIYAWSKMWNWSKRFNSEVRKFKDKGRIGIISELSTN